MSNISKYYNLQDEQDIFLSEIYMHGIMDGVCIKWKRVQMKGILIVPAFDCRYKWGTEQITEVFNIAGPLRESSVIHCSSSRNPASTNSSWMFCARKL